MHMEKFKNALIPVELVWYAYYDEDENETNVVLSAPNATQGFSSRTVSFTGNHLNSFNKWYAKVTSKNPPPGNYINLLPQTYISPVFTGGDDDETRGGCTTTVCETTIGRGED